jgi:hypothetical protein
MALAAIFPSVRRVGTRVVPPPMSDYARRLPMHICAYTWPDGICGVLYLCSKVYNCSLTITINSR